MARRDSKGITIIRREEVVAAAHHGGAWKVAYADFVTAMMAFFLLMWLLNATTEVQRHGLADYFSPSASVNVQRSGTGKPLGGKSPFEDGVEISDRGTIAVMHENAPPVDQQDDGSDKIDNTSGASAQTGPDEAGGKPPMAAAMTAAERAAEAARQAEQAGFAKAQAAIQQAVATDPALAPLAKQLSVDLTPEGLRVQIRDAEGKPMFASGSAEPDDRARLVLQRLVPILLPLKEKLSIAGYTDAAPYAGEGRSNWDLSADRANATRRILTESGLADDRIRDVTGRGDRDLLLPTDPLAAANRRIAILLVRSAPLAKK